jgi:hypothetical protein
MLRRAHDATKADRSDDIFRTLGHRGDPELRHEPLVEIDEISGALACLLPRQRLDRLRYAPGP